MRIGILTNYLAVAGNTDSGIGQHYRILADALVDQGHFVHVIHPTLDPNGVKAALAASEPAWSYEIVPVRSPAWVDSALRRSWPTLVLLAQLRAARVAALVMAEAVRRLGLQIFETHATGTPALGYLRCLGRVAVVTRLSTTARQLNASSRIFSRVNQLQTSIEKLAVKASDALVTHTRAHRDTICAEEGYCPDAFAIVPHGLPDVPTTSRQTPEKNATVRILYVGRFENRKGTDVLLDAIPAVAEACPQTHFILAGSTGDGELWRQFTQRHPRLAGSRVVATGKVGENRLNELYAACDIFVAPSRYESFGLIYLEAMRHGKPVIGCRAGGIPDVVTDGVTGLLAEPGDVTGLSTLLRRLATDAKYRSALGKSGRVDFLRRFSAVKMAERSAILYEKVTAVSRGQGV